MDKIQSKNDLFSKNSDNTEIKNIIYTWLSENGIVNKLQSQIRLQMITVLKDNLTSNSNKINITTTMFQTINLLIAEFLLYQENFNTLSIFISEVPLLGKLHVFSSYVNYSGNNVKRKPIIKPHFQSNEVNDILEELGIQLNTDIVTLACQYYFNNKDNTFFSLLTCLFKALRTINNDTRYCEIKNNYKTLEIYENRLNDSLVSVEEDQYNIVREAVIHKEQKSLYEIINILQEKEKSSNEKYRKLEEEYEKKLKYINIQNCELELKDKKISNLENMLKNVNQNISSTTSSTISESDVIDDDNIIKEARTRLRSLEIKTANMELNFKKNWRYSTQK